jgi:hypothetical protein
MQQLKRREEEGNGQQAHAATNFRDENLKRILSCDPLDPSVAYATDWSLVLVASVVLVSWSRWVLRARHPKVPNPVGAAAMEVLLGGLFGLRLSGIHRWCSACCRFGVGQGVRSGLPCGQNKGGAIQGHQTFVITPAVRNPTSLGRL